MDVEDLKEQLLAAYKHRAILYYLIYDEVRKEMGAERAAEAMKRAIRRRGEQLGAKFARFAPDDMEGLRKAFAVGSEIHRWLFEPQVDHCGPDGLDVTHRRCPLVEAWKEIGLDDEETATMCEIAAAVDEGTFEAAGFNFSAETWTGGEGCCHLHIRPAKK